jgi:hypothetical protein
MWLIDGGFSGGKQPGKQYRGFHLRAGDWRYVIDCAQFTASNVQRRPIARSGADLCSHQS